MKNNNNNKQTKKQSLKTVAVHGVQSTELVFIWFMPPKHLQPQNVDASLSSNMLEQYPAGWKVKVYPLQSEPFQQVSLTQPEKGV